MSIRKPSPGRKPRTAVKSVAPKTLAPKTKTASARPHPVVRKSGVYHNNDNQCMEITNQFGRCKRDVHPGSTFCLLHQRRPQQHEDKFFDSTFACVHDNIWIGSLDTTNDPNALIAAGIKNIVNISGFEPRQKTRDMYRKLGINYRTLTHRDSSGKIQFLGDEPINTREKLNRFYRYMDDGVTIISKLPRGATLVNCFAGINRSASLIAAYLVAAKGMTFAQAEHLLKVANSKRKIEVLTNKSFVEAMKVYANHRKSMQIMKK